MLTTYWRVDQADPLTSTDFFGTFAHVYDLDSNQVQIVDGQALPGYLWKTGDVHIHQM